MCENNNLTLNTAKTKEIIVEEEEIPPELEVERVSCLGIYISEDV